LDRRKHLSLLIVRGDGTRVVRVSFPRRLSLMAVAGFVVVVVGLGVLVGDWWITRVRVQELGGLLRQVDGQGATITALKGRMGDLQKEIGSWRELHARIWEPFGPDAAPRGRPTGIGGARVADTGSERPPGPADPAPSARPADDLDRLTEVVRQEGESLRALERLISRAGKVLASLPSRWPVRGVVNSEFGGRRSPWTKDGEFHSGMDIAAERGTPVQAPAAGTVTFAGTHAEYGLTVMIDHGDDLRTIYGHLSRISVTLGQKVARGGELGLTGNTGRSSGPHLHYEILVKNRAVNPRAYLWD
jgi:murein DD-endopeptidase MepM/ murein hydrolase activator NlpD